MDSPERGALMLVRIFGVGLLGWALAELALYIAVCHHKSEPVEIFPCVMKSLPFLAGVVVLIKSSALAEWLSDKLDL
ncbi:MAG TPA: hypothetical protein VIK62_08700 [Verrucomicrobiae bacterium]